MRYLVSCCLLGVAVLFGGDRLVSQEEGVEENLSTLKFANEVMLAELREPLDQLDSFYENKLRELEQNYQDQGNLERILPVKAEREAFRESPTDVPEESIELRKLQAIYLDARKTRYPEYAGKAANLLNQYQEQLKLMVAGLTKSGKLDEAVEAKTEIERVAEEIATLEQNVGNMQSNERSSLSIAGEPDWNAIRKIFETENWEAIPEVAGTGGGSEYHDSPDEPGILIGLELQFSDFRGHDTVRGVRGIYLTEKGRKESDVVHGFQKGDPKNVYARKGYALGGLDVFSDSSSIRRAKLTFYRIKGDRLDPRDKYETEWYGEYEDGSFSKCFSDGRPIVGFKGIEGIGLGNIQFLVGGK